MTGDRQAVEPVRAYVGLHSSDGDDAQRAQLAVAELNRLGGLPAQEVASIKRVVAPIRDPQ